jgi:hypothetical protein
MLQGCFHPKISGPPGNRDDRQEETNQRWAMPGRPDLGSRLIVHILADLGTRTYGGFDRGIE